MTNNIDEYFDKLSSLLLSFTCYYNEKVIQKILNEERYADEPERFYFTIVSKTNGSLDVANLLIRNFYYKPHFHPSLFIIIRSILSDIVVGEYVNMTAKDDADIKEKIDSIYSDHIVRIYKSINKSYAQLDEWTQDRIEEEQKKALAAHPKYLDLLGKPKFKLISFQEMIHEIFLQKTSDQDFSVYREIYSNYDMFSKYEHFGELSFHLLHKPFTERSIREKFADVYQCIKITITVLRIYCSIWGDLLSEEMEVLQKMSEDIFQYDLGFLPEE